MPEPLVFEGIPTVEFADSGASLSLELDVAPEGEPWVILRSWDERAEKQRRGVLEDLSKMPTTGHDRLRPLAGRKLRVTVEVIDE
jgi:hypothetical protein